MSDPDFRSITQILNLNGYSEKQQLESYKLLGMAVRLLTKASGDPDPLYYSDQWVAAENHIFSQLNGMGISKNKAKKTADAIMWTADNIREKNEKANREFAEMEKLKQSNGNAAACEAEEHSNIETARKAGYVQGVCECVAAIGEDHALGKKLLTEMNINKEMAKKYANPETYKTLEQGIFAPNPEQKIEQTRGRKR